MSPEVEDYAAMWIEAEGQTGSLEHNVFTILLGVDGNSCLDCQQVATELLQFTGKVG